MSQIERIPLIAVSYNTPDLVLELVSSFRQFYPNKIYIIDGSDPQRAAETKALIQSFEDVEFHPFGYNIHHGPGMAWAVANLGLSGLALFLDTDVAVLQGGFLEVLEAAFKPGLYGVGGLSHIDAQGLAVSAGPGSVPYLHPWCMLCDLDEMRKWPLPVKHGAPMIQAMVALQAAGRSDLLENVPGLFERDYLRHGWQGTVSRTGGYHLQEAGAPPEASEAPEAPEAPAAPAYDPDLLRFIPPGARRLVLAGRDLDGLAVALRSRNPGCHLLRLVDEQAPEPLPLWDACCRVDLDTADEAFFQRMADRTCWVLADALGGLRAPLALLSGIRRTLPADGCIVASAHNAQNWMLQAKLAIGDWRFLDSGRLHWFTRATLLEVFQAAGLRVADGCSCLSGQELPAAIQPLIRAMAEAVGADGALAVQDSAAAQFVIVAAPDAASAPPAPAAAPTRPRDWPRERPGELLAFFEGTEHRLIHKWMHYFDIYERHLAKFKGQDISLLEFGVSHGGSLQMWKHYFGPAARIFGADLDPRCQALEEERIRIFLVDQGDPAQLEQLKTELPALDIVIDDGGHHMHQQIGTLESMFAQLKDGGIYLAEDLHTSYWPEFGGGHRRPGSFIEYAKGLVDKLNAWHVRDGAEPVAEFTRWAYGLHFYDSVLVIEKRAMVRPEGRMTGTASW